MFRRTPLSQSSRPVSTTTTTTTMSMTLPMTAPQHSHFTGRKASTSTTAGSLKRSKESSESSPSESSSSSSSGDMAGACSTSSSSPSPSSLLSIPNGHHHDMARKAKRSSASRSTCCLTAVMGCSSSSSSSSPSSSLTSSKGNHHMSGAWYCLDRRVPVLIQFLLITLAVYLFFGIHNLLQEAIMERQHKKNGIMLGATEVLGVCWFSFLERRCLANERGGWTVPLSYYPLLTACLLGSSALSNMALNYINFPTKVVFRSSKLIPTMMVASIMQRQVFTCIEYLCAAAISIGLILFTAADWDLAPNFHPIGIFLISASVFSDAVLPNAQERIFAMGASRLEVTLYTNIFALMAYTFMALASGDLWQVWQLALQDQTLAIYYLVYIVVAYFAVSAHMAVVHRFGSVVAVLVATGRKGMTLILSFVLFPKPFSWYYPIGANLVLGGLLVVSLYQLKLKHKKPKTPRHSPPPSLSLSLSLCENPATMGEADLSATNAGKGVGMC